MIQSTDARERLAEVIAAVGCVDSLHEQAAWDRLDTLTKPPRSLGRLESIAAQVAAIQRTDHPHVDSKFIILAAGDHGVVDEGVSAYPQEVTAQMVANFATGGAAINQICTSVGAHVVVYDVGVAGPLAASPGVIDAKIAPGTRNFTRAAAMTEQECAAAIMAGVDAVDELVGQGAQLIGTGEMGIGNSTAAAALTAALTGASVASVVGPGTGVDGDGITRKIDAIERGIALHGARDLDAFRVLACLGGLEIAMLCGVMLAGAARGVPVVADGFISGSAALCAVGMCPAARDHLLASHRSAEPGHQVALDHLGLEPILVLDMRLGEGTGAALSFAVIDAACRVLSGMATFASAGVSQAGESR